MKILWRPNILYIVAFVTVILSACTKEQEIVKEFPSIYTFEAENISETGAVFKAEITKNKNIEILKRGFIWGKSWLFPYESDTIIVPLTNEKIYSTTVDYALPMNDDISFCGIVWTNDYKVQGNIKNLVSKGCKPAIINDYNPKEGSEGELIVISGDNFTSILSKYEVIFVKFNNNVVTSFKRGTVISASKNKIVIKIKTPSNYGIIPNSDIKSPVHFNYDIPDSEYHTIILRMFDDEYLVGDFRLDTLKID